MHTYVTEARPKQKTVFLELLRIVACFFVIVNHTNSTIFLGTTPSLLWFASLTYFFMSKIAVPIFVMISGYTMLDRQESYGKVFRRFLRIIACLMLFSLFYYYVHLKNAVLEPMTVRQMIEYTFRGPMTNAFWYLYLYLGLLLMLPFLQKMVMNMERRDFHVYFLLSGFLCGIWPIIAHYAPAWRMSSHFLLPVFNSYLLMLLLGCYVKRYGRFSWAWVCVAVLGFAAMCALNVFLTYKEYIALKGVSYLFFDNRELFPIVAAAFCVFYVASVIPFGEKMGKLLVFFGNLTFGIYLISDYMITELAPLYKHLISAGIYPMIAVVIYEAVIFMAGAAVAFVLKKLPVFRKLL